MTHIYADISYFFINPRLYIGIYVVIIRTFSTHAQVATPMPMEPKYVRSWKTKRNERSQRMWREALQHNSPPSRGQASCGSVHGSVAHPNWHNRVGETTRNYPVVYRSWHTYMPIYIGLNINHRLYIGIYVVIIRTSCGDADANGSQIRPKLKKKGMNVLDSHICRYLGLKLNPRLYIVRSMICMSPVATGWVSRSHGDPTRGDGRHTDPRSDDIGISVVRVRTSWTHAHVDRPQIRPKLNKKEWTVLTHIYADISG